uniref:Uncharacterized protein LOC114328832 n=1 Tax=Diabrotica virgifera virgifera TaxID=50390 RepID=A0A6P7FKX3_DIAVI
MLSTAIIILSMLRHLQATTLIQEIPNNGYYEELIGPSKTISHYHKHIIQINLSNIEQILTNSSLTFSNLLPKVTGINLLSNQYKHLLTETEDNLNKITRKPRLKRGLLNILGTTIKFITGNPDNNDMELLNLHINAIEAKQDELISKYNKQISFGDTFNTRIDNLLRKINDNNKILSNALDHLSQQLAVINEIFEIQLINGYIQKLIRTITLSQLNIPNVEFLFEFMVSM